MCNFAMMTRQVSQPASEGEEDESVRLMAAVMMTSGGTGFNDVSRAALMLQCRVCEQDQYSQWTAGRGLGLGGWGGG